MSWFRLPTWCIGRDHREDAIVAMWVLGEWHIGREVSASSLRAEFGWGWARSAAMIDRLWVWAGEENAARPAVARAPRNGAETKPVSQRCVSGESPVSRDTVVVPIVEAGRGVSGGSPVSQRCVSRARSSLERDVDEEEHQITPGLPATVDDGRPTPKAVGLFDASAVPVAAVVDPPKVKRTRTTKAPTTDTHARETIAAWCDAYSTGTGQPYTITSGDAGRLKRVAADYLTGEAWPEKLATLATGMATYIAATDRWPKGPPTVGGFCIDPQRWIAQKPANTTPAPMALHNPY